MTKLPPQKNQTEFSRIIKLNEWLDKESKLEFHLEEHEKKDLAKRLDVKIVHTFKLLLNIQRVEKDLIDFDIDGVIIAQWENSKSDVFDIEETFKTKVLHSSLSLADDDFLEDIEYTDDGNVDVGEIATQYLIIMIDEKYAEMEIILENSKVEATHNPFSILKNIKDE
ncbi:MAG: hypothetical protein C0432_05435 [Candidatus Puniceispirillum sp.]|nr:hypothetical protein [Candidatus Pelagibacter sp.]MBA4283716.1 hypothetical protein [Candidatus Puniceispirillum sp.]